MNRFIADDFEMRRVARSTDHVRRIATDQQGLPRYEMMMIVEIEGMGMRRQRAMIVGNLAKILAAVLQIELERTDGRRPKLDQSQFALDCRVIDRQLTARYDACIETARPGHEAAEIFLIKSTAQAFANQHGILGENGRDAPVSEHVGKKEIAAGLQNPQAFTIHPRPIGINITHPN